MIIQLQMIRHGKTEAVDRMIYSGFSDLSLTEAGIAEIGSFIDMGLYHKADAYYSSGLMRAVQTLNLIAGQVKWKEIPQLKECNFGDFELHKHDDLMKNPNYVDWINDQTGNNVIPNGESTNQFHSRVEEGFRLLFSDANQNQTQSVMLTTHGGVIGYFITKYCDASLNFYEAMPSHGRGYLVAIEKNDEEFKVLNFERI